MYSNKANEENMFIIDITNSKDRDSLETSDMNNRGMIFKTINDENVLVASTFPYTEEYSINNIDVVDKLIQEGQWEFVKSYEGTIIRVVHVEQEGVIKRLVSTHKKLDAFESYWGSNKSYGELFKTEICRLFRNDTTIKGSECNMEDTDIFNLFLDSLDTSRHYTFLLTSNDDNKIVSSNNNKIFVVGSFDRVTNDFLYDFESHYNKTSIVKLDTPEKINIATSQDIIDTVNSVDYNKHQGIFAIRKDKFQFFKVINDDYKNKSMLRGNNSNLLFRYLQLKYVSKDNSSNTLLTEFVKLFSSHADTFNSAETNLVEIAVYLHQTYYRRNIKKEFVFVHAIFHSVLKSIHSWHVQDRRNNITTLDAVVSKLNEVDTRTLFQMLKHWTSMKETNDNVLF